MTFENMAHARSIAVEGLPGAGKSTLVLAIAAAHPGFSVVPELVLPVPVEPTRRFFVENDREKVRLAALAPASVLDRFWASTAAYVLAETRMSQPACTAFEVISALYGRMPVMPTMCIFLDSQSALEEAFALDGHFANSGFRSELRSAYFDVFLAASLPTVVVHDGSHARAEELVAQALGAHVSTTDAGSAKMQSQRPPRVRLEDE